VRVCVPVLGVFSLSVACVRMTSEAVAPAWPLLAVVQSRPRTSLSSYTNITNTAGFFSPPPPIRYCSLVLSIFTFSQFDL